jgi:hypothetical protein
MQGQPPAQDSEQDALTLAKDELKPTRVRRDVGCVRACRRARVKTMMCVGGCRLRRTARCAYLSGSPSVFLPRMVGEKRGVEKEVKRFKNSPFDAKNEEKNLGRCLSIVGRSCLLRQCCWTLCSFRLFSGQPGVVLASFCYSKDPAPFLSKFLVRSRLLVRDPNREDSSRERVCRMVVA